MSRRKITVDFTPSRRVAHPLWRRFGGQGMLSKPEPYAGPAFLEFKGHVARGEVRTFRAVHLNRSPTGSGHGSFRIEETLKDGRIVVRGYTCSWPDFDMCRLVASGSSNH